MNIKEIIKEEIKKLLNENDMNDILLSARTLLSKYSYDMSQKFKDKLFYHLRKLIFQNYQEEYIDMIIDYIMKNLNENDRKVFYYSCDSLSNDIDG